MLAGSMAAAAGLSSEWSASEPVAPRAVTPPRDSTVDSGEPAALGVLAGEPSCRGLWTRGRGRRRYGILHIRRNHERSHGASLDERQHELGDHR